MRRTRPIYAVLAAALLGLIVLPIAFAGASEGPETKAAPSANVKNQVKKLKRQIRGLQRQIDELARQPGPQGPEGPQGPPGPATGPAGGDLRGSYPNPQLAPNAVASDELADNSVGVTEIANNAVTNEEIADETVTGGEITNNQVGFSDLGTDAVRADELAPDSVGSSEVQPDSVGSSELKDAIAVVGSGVTVSAGTPRDAEVTCPPSHPQLSAGGYAWQDDELNSIVHSAPRETDPNRTWIVRGMVNAGSNNLFAWATCIPS
jgi:hypothetical protein